MNSIIGLLNSIKKCNETYKYSKNKLKILVTSKLRNSWSMTLFYTYFCVKYFLKYIFPIFDVWGNKIFMVSRNMYRKSFLFYYDIVFGAIIFVNKNMFGAIKDSACVSYTFLTPFTPLHFHYYQSTMNSLSPMLHCFYAAVATSLPVLLCIATILFGVSCIGTLKQN